MHTDRCQHPRDGCFDLLKMVSCAMVSGSALQQRTALATPLQSRSRVLKAGRPARQTTRALSDTNLVISGATAVSLALGRFVFLDFQRDNARRQGLPQANGVEYSKAGDKLSEEASFLKGTNDPAGTEPCQTCNASDCIPPRATLSCRLQHHRCFRLGSHRTCSGLCSLGHH